MTDEAVVVESLNEFSVFIFVKESEGHVLETRIHFLKGEK